MTTFTTAKNGFPMIQMRVGASLDYSFNWSAWLGAVGDSIASYTVDVPAGLTKSGDKEDSGIVTAWLDAIRLGYQYHVRCDIVTTSSPPRRDSRTIVIEVIA